MNNQWRSQGLEEGAVTRTHMEVLYQEQNRQGAKLMVFFK